MKGKSGNLIISLKSGNFVEVDGPAIIKIKEIKKNKAVILVNADDNTKISVKRESTDKAEQLKETAKD